MQSFQTEYGGKTRGLRIALFRFVSARLVSFPFRPAAAGAARVRVPARQHCTACAPGQILDAAVRWPAGGPLQQRQL